MDYTTVYRPLIYKNREDIDDFPVDETSSPEWLTMEAVFMEKLEARPFIKDNINAPELILAIFNNARYIAILIFSENHPQHYLRKYLKIAENGGRDILSFNHVMPATMALVVNYLLHYEGEILYGSKIIKAIIDNFNDWDAIGAPEGKHDFYDLLIDRTSETDKYPRWLSDKEIKRRDIQEVLNDNDIDPYEIIGGLDYIIQETFGMYSGDPECPQIMKGIKAIMENFERTEQISETTWEMLDIAYQKLKKAYPYAGLKWEDNISTPRLSSLGVNVQGLSLQSSRMLNPCFDADNELQLGQVAELKEEVNRLSKEKAELEGKLKEAERMDECRIKEIDKYHAWERNMEGELTMWQSEYESANEALKKAEHERDVYKELLDAKPGTGKFTVRQTAIIAYALCRKGGFIPKNKKSISKVFQHMTGRSANTLGMHLCSNYTDDEIEEIAIAVEKDMPEFASYLREKNFFLPEMKK